MHGEKREAKAHLHAEAKPYENVSLCQVSLPCCPPRSCLVCAVEGDLDISPVYLPSSGILSPAPPARLSSSGLSVACGSPCGWKDSPSRCPRVPASVSTLQGNSLGRGRGAGTGLGKSETRQEWVMPLEPAGSLGAEFPFPRGVGLLPRPPAGGARPAYRGRTVHFPLI